MKFEKLTVGSFGKLEDREFVLSEGLNIIYGKNESGKSTLSAFIKYILYGFSSQKSRSVQSNDKLKYLSWKTATAFGSAELSVSGNSDSAKQHYRIERVNASKSTVKVTDGNGKECVFGKEPGECLLGVDEASFVKMAFIRQTDVSADKMSGISDHIQNTVYSADETVDIEKARKKLSDYRNAYRGKARKTGRYYELEEKISALKRDFADASEKHKALLEAEAKLEETRQNIEQHSEKLKTLDSELKNIEAFEAKKLLEKIAEAKNALEKAQAKHLSAKSEFEFFKNINSDEAFNAVNNLESAYNNYLSAEKELEAAKDELAGAESERKSKEKDNSVLARAHAHARFDGSAIPNIEALKTASDKLESGKKLAIIFAALMFAAAAVVGAFGKFLFVGMQKPEHYFIPLCAGFAAAGIVFSVLAAVKAKKVSSLFLAHGFENKADFSSFAKDFPEAQSRLTEYSARENVLICEVQKKTNISENAKKQLEKILSALALALIFSESSDTGFSSKAELINKLKNSVSRFKAAENELFKAQSLYNGICESKNITELEDAAKAFTHIPEREKAAVMREKDYYSLALKNLEAKEKDFIRRAAAPASSFRKPSEILSEKIATEALLANAAQNADAAETALEALDAACDDLKSSVSPRIAKRAGELFSIFTDGKYSSLQISHEFEMGISDSGMNRESGYLSQGTQDAAYLALRIAMCEVLFAEKPVIVLDEAFAYIDDERLNSIIAALSKLSKDFQILIFTCHEREKKALSRLGSDDVNVIEL